VDQSTDTKIPAESKRVRRQLNARGPVGALACVVLALTAACGGGGGGGGSIAVDTPGSGTPPPANAPPPTTGDFFPAGTQVPVTGPDVPGVAGFDSAVEAMMRQWNVPGVGLAIAKDGRLILARGYGYQDFEARTPMQPDTMVLVGSVSKVITSIAVLQLRDQGRLDLDAKVFDMLTQYTVQPGGDARLRDITVRELLEHAGGWDKSLRDDFTNQPIVVAQTLGIPTPVTCADVVRYAMTQPLDFAPGTRQTYSNVGFCILGRLVEKISGQTYESYVRDHVLAPASINAMSIGRPHVSGRLPGEAKYYAYTGAPLVDSLYAGEGKVTIPYCCDPLAYEGAGGWVGSAVDMTRLMTALDGSRVQGLLSADSKAQMLANPHLPHVPDADEPAGSWWGLGVNVGPDPNRYGHGGIMGGSRSLLVHDERGYVMAIVANTSPLDTTGFSAALADAVVKPLVNGLQGSAQDLYPQYPSPSVPARNP
jgi:N-acyl-D-amino-acid deacylase